MKKGGLILICTTIICSSAVKIVRIIKNPENGKKVLPIHIKIYTNEAGEK